MPKLTIDGIEVEVPAGTTVLQACEAAGVEIPRFCYHERLSIAGNCRMCLVELEKAPKPIASCAYPAADNMVIRTTTPMVKQARHGVMEFLLANHPLDCPICDQGGECDLQDQAMAYGFDHSRFMENKRAVTDKYLGPLVKTVMTRCIHCTRCVRFAQEVAGVPDLGGLGRGESMEIGTYVEQAIASELSGNLIDLCPVGALTSAPYAFTARPWELKKTDGIDVADAVGANIRIDTRGPEVLRILPRVNEAVNEEWLGDKGRFWVDGLKRRRLDRPWVRKDGTLQPASWAEAFGAIAAKLKNLPGEKIGALAGDHADAEAMQALLDLMRALGSPNTDCRVDGAALDASRADFWRFNATIAGIDQADAVLLVGTNPRHEAPVLNARIRRRWVATGLPVGLAGPAADLTYPAEHFADGPGGLRGILDGSHHFARTLAEAKRPMVIVGQGALRRPDGAAVLAAAWAIARNANAITPDWHGFNVLHTAAARVGGLELGFVPGAGGLDARAMLSGGADFLWLLNVDDADLSGLGGTFVVYQGSHGDAGAARADVVLPGAAYTEKDATWVNTEGRAQRSAQALFPPGDAREDFKIIRAFSAVVGRALPYDTADALRARHPLFGLGFAPVRTGDTTGPAGDPAAMGDAPFVPAVPTYYMTDPISRASPTMAACVRDLAGPKPTALAAE
jgi:NADH-quinone oxidoreductase subunit G